MAKTKTIYVLRWSTNGNVPHDGLCFNSKKRAESCAKFNNKKNRNWLHRLTGGVWKVDTLRFDKRGDND